MASPSSPQHEPTMEEILASIRKIISEDSNDSQPAVAAAPAPAAQDADVLELTQEVHEASQPAPAPQPVRVTAAPEPVRPADDVVFQSIEETPVSVVAQTPGSGGLISDKTRSAIDDALSGLDFGRDEAPAPAPQAAAPSRPIPSVAAAGGSVEAVFDRAVRETFDPVLRSWLNDQGEVLMEKMKPAIREWMEAHLPDMLKAAVEEEVARAVRSRAKR